MGFQEGIVKGMHTVFYAFVKFFVPPPPSSLPASLMPKCWGKTYFLPSSPAPEKTQEKITLCDLYRVSVDSIQTDRQTDRQQTQTTVRFKNDVKSHPEGEVYTVFSVANQSNSKLLIVAVTVISHIHFESWLNELKGS